MTASMKKIIAWALALILTAAAAGTIGYLAGKEHVIKTQELWILDDEHDDSCDFEIHANIDGDWHIYNGFLG